MELAAHQLEIEVGAYVLSGDGRRANVEGAGIRESGGDFISQRVAEVVDAEISIEVLQRQHRDRIFGGLDICGAMFDEPGPNRRQHGDQ